MKYILYARKSTEEDEKRAKEDAKTTVQNPKADLVETETKLEKLLDAYLGEVISAEDYKARKDKFLTQKVELGEKIRDFEQKGLSWLEPCFRKSSIRFCPQN